MLDTVKMPELPRSNFFDLPPRGIAARPAKLGLTLEHVRAAMKQPNAPLRPPPLPSGGVSGGAAGLSNAPYFTVAKGQTIEMLIRPASALVKVRPARQHKQFDIGYTETKRRAKRGRIREFSDKSRLGLQLLAADLQEIIKKPDLMLTLTYPAEWRSVTTDWTCRCEASEGCSDVPCVCDFSPSGKVCKKHIDTFYKRLKRYLKAVDITGWGALWFLEFQARGAPHFHLLLWGLGFMRFDLDAFQKWLSKGWAEIVSHSNQHEYQKHLRAGTRAEWMKKEHFGYALKYAAKMKQKQVPREFADIGRFWGCWNNPIAEPVLRALYVSTEGLKKIGRALKLLIYKHSKEFSAELISNFADAIDNPETQFSKRVFGRESAEYLLSYGKLPLEPLH